MSGFHPELTSGNGCWRCWPTLGRGR